MSYQNDICYKHLFDRLNFGVVILKPIKDGTDFIIKDINKRAAEIDCIEKNNVIDRKITSIFSCIDKSGLLKRMRKVYEKDLVIEYPITYYEDSKLQEVRNYYIYKIATDELIITYNDITEQKKEEEKNRYLSFHDPLTKLYNRRYFENEMKRLNRSRKKPISIIVADIDRLKDINDNYGHPKGDKYIKKAAEIIKSSLREEDIAARIGGDEYAVILPETDGNAADKICQRIYDRCGEVKFARENLDLSVGYSTYRTGEDSLNEVFVRADKEMYNNRGKALFK